MLAAVERARPVARREPLVDLEHRLLDQVGRGALDGRVGRLALCGGRLLRIGRSDLREEAPPAAQRESFLFFFPTVGKRKRRS